MKLIINNNNGIISDCFCYHNDNAFNLIVNHYRYEFMSERRERSSIFYELLNTSEIFDGVALFPESEDDVKILERKRFDCRSKHQWHAIFPIDKLIDELDYDKTVRV